MLIDMFKQAYMFRPGFIQPMKGVKSSTGWYRVAYMIFGVLYPLLKRIAPNTVMSTIELSQSMLNAVHHGYSKKVLETRHIIELGKKYE